MIGRTIGSYVVEERLGQGGMGVVYRARDTKLNRPVALKVLPPALVRDPDRRRRFLQEARAASAVNHPAIAQIYDIQESGDEAFIVMEYVNGSTLSQLVARRALETAPMLDVAIQVGDALARAHEAGIVHRDIKPDNIMVTTDGHPKVLDFGLAKLLDRPSGIRHGDDTLAETMALTQAGLIVGTLSYMSPEHARGQPADIRSDIFSFGIVLYQATTGRLPFERGTALDTMHAIAYDDPQPVSTLRADLPYSLHRVVDRCLRKKPEERYQQMREVVDDLRQVKREVETGASGSMPLLDRLAWWMKGWSRRGIAYAAVAGAVLGAMGAYVLLGRDRSPIGLLFVGVLGALIYRRLRNRGQREVEHVVRKASAFTDVRVILFHKGEFVVIVDAPSAATYVRLNALVSAANARLFHGDPMVMTILDDVASDDLRGYLARPGVRYVRDDVPVSAGIRGDRRP